ncbi:hypothetical protein C8R46DRAFT_332106 [Mycena filopes]|nr:hypothetical protein C8R46DRAFT_332106 [Mycena filopes]
MRRTSASMDLSERRRRSAARMSITRRIAVRRAGFLKKIRRKANPACAVQLSNVTAARPPQLFCPAAWRARFKKNTRREANPVSAVQRRNRGLAAENSPPPLRPGFRIFPPCGAFNLTLSCARLTFPFAVALRKSSKSLRRAARRRRFANTVVASNAASTRKFKFPLCWTAPAVAIWLVLDASKRVQSRTCYRLGPGSKYATRSSSCIQIVDLLASNAES